MTQQEIFDEDKVLTMWCSFHYDPENRIIELDIKDKKWYNRITVDPGVVYFSGGVARMVKEICDRYHPLILTISENIPGESDKKTELWSSKFKDYHCTIGSGDLLIKAN